MLLLQLISFVLFLSLANAFQRISDTAVKLDLRKRNNDAMAIETSFTQTNNTFYEVEIGFGTPVQKVRLLVDTGSSDTWVHSSEVYSNDTAVAEYGVFNPNVSSTLKDIKMNFMAQYNDGSLDLGFYVTDTLTIGDSNKTATEFQFAVVNNSSDKIGILGLGPRENENTTKLYSNLPVYLKDKHIIDKARFSLVLDDASGQTGSIIFGSTDDNKYIDHSNKEGQLVSHDLGLVNSKFTYYAVEITGLYRGDKKITFSNTYSHFDTGYPTIQMPSQIYDYVGKLLNVTFVKDLDRYVFSCTRELKLTFGFGKQNITIPARNLATDVVLLNGTQKCLLGITRNSKSQFVFGDIFFKNIYTVFDLHDKKVLFAKAKRADTRNVMINGNLIANGTISGGGNSAGPCNCTAHASQNNSTYWSTNNRTYGNSKCRTTTTLQPGPSSFPTGSAAASTSNNPWSSESANANADNYSKNANTNPWIYFNDNSFGYALHGLSKWWNKDITTWLDSSALSSIDGLSYYQSDNTRWGSYNDYSYGSNTGNSGTASKSQNSHSQSHSSANYANGQTTNSYANGQTNNNYANGQNYNNKNTGNTGSTSNQNSNSQNSNSQYSSNGQSSGNGNGNI